MKRIVVVACLIVALWWVAPLLAEETVYEGSTVSEGFTVLPKSDDVPVRSENRVIGTGKDLDVPVRVREVQGDSIRVWVRKLHTSGWIKRSDVCTSGEAIKHFTKRIATDPNDAVNYFYRSAANCDYGRHLQAVEDAMESLRLLPSARTYTLRANIWRLAFGREIEGYDNDQAIKDHDEAIRLDPKSSVAYCHRGETKDAGDDPEGADADYTEAIRLDPKDPWPYFIRGAFGQADNSDPDKAIADFTVAIQLDPSNGVCGREAYASRGMRWAEKEEHDKAIADFTEAIRLDPEDALLFHNRGKEWSAKGDSDKAIADYTEAVRVESSDWNHPPFLNSRGIEWSKKREYNKAIADFTEAIRLDSKDASAYSNRGRAWTEQGNYDKAVEDYNRSLRLDPDSFDACHQMAWLLATCPNAKFRDGTRSVALATKSLELWDSKDASLQNTLAAAYAEAGRFEEATEAQLMAIELADESNKADYRSRLELYKAEKPFHKTAKTRKDPP